MRSHATRIGGAMIAAALLVPIAGQARADDDVTKMTASEIVGAITEGKMTAQEVAEASLAVAQEKSGLNAFITLDRSRALAEARNVDQRIAASGASGPLAGVPIVVKDNILVSGLRATAGTPGLDSFVPTRTAPVAQRLLDNGAVLIGKTNMHELAFGITSNNAAYGAVGNAVAPDRFAGGSSGGTATAIAAGMAAAGLGTDTGGSVRIPAALNGLVGLRPTTGRYPSEGIVPISSTRDTAGPMARTVADVALLDAVITQGDVNLDGVDLATVRLGVPEELVANLSPGVKASFDDALATLEEAGVTLVPVKMDDIMRMSGEAGFPIALYEVKRDLTAFLADRAPDRTLDGLVAAIASPDVKGVFDNAVMGENGVPDEVYRKAVDTLRPAMQEAYRTLFAENTLDAIVFPTTPLEAQPIEGSDETVTLNGEAVPTFEAFIRNTDPGSILGVPGVTLPIATTEEGLPVGLELDGAADGDRRLLAIALAVEGVVGE
ncbi:indoleacetamide hydrolase [Acuticoccus sp. M5D2P5]|uniref:indoleacetamide hydrolase n=1 Tax=Acuticoccus kalidii TaxID=2910977 RepID=UPI001F2538CB|nr:indoleacetamide hydrolase [Acuticoccus kalidii]MCF3933039.1 indoleacetamide hydrolase [Acuticoccus kalidii]